MLASVLADETAEAAAVPPLTASHRLICLLSPPSTRFVPLAAIFSRRETQK